MAEEIAASASELGREEREEEREDGEEEGREGCSFMNGQLFMSPTCNYMYLNRSSETREATHLESPRHTALLNARTSMGREEWGYVSEDSSRRQNDNLNR